MTKSPSQLERDAERVRSEIADTAEQLREKMTPGQLMDQMVDYLKDGDANRLLVNLKHQVRDNPLALALVGGGLAWLMMGSGPSHSVQASHPRRPNGGIRTEPGTAATTRPSMGTATAPAGPATSKHSSTGQVAGAFAGGVSGAREAVSSASDKVKGAAESAHEAADSARDAMNRGMHDLRDYAADGISELEHAGAQMAERARAGFADALEREPLVIGALGVAVGAAIGAMLPPTRAEREYLGPAAARAREGAEAALHEGTDRAKHAASDAYAAAREEADRQGLVPHGKPLAEKAADVARAAGRELKSAAGKSMHDLEDKADATTNRVSAEKVQKK